MTTRDPPRKMITYELWRLISDYFQYVEHLPHDQAADKADAIDSYIQNNVRPSELVQETG